MAELDYLLRFGYNIGDWCATSEDQYLVIISVAVGISYIPNADSTDSIMAIATGYDWDKISFASTLFLCPIIDKMLLTVPRQWHPEIRLGLQEALVNAAKHGNNLDPLKRVVVRFCLVEGNYWWIISDEGAGFENPCGCRQEIIDRLPEYESENGRGMSLLHQIFDQVVWNSQGTELRLCKQLECREPMVC